MLSLKRQQQKVWVTVATKKEIEQDGLPTGEFFNYLTKPEMYKLSVSATAGNPQVLEAGVVIDYDREITSFNKKLKLNVGDLLFIDVIPEIDNEGELVLSDDNMTPVTPPDYIVKKVLDTQVSNVARYGIEKRV